MWCARTYGVRLVDNNNNFALRLWQAYEVSRTTDMLHAMCARFDWPTHSKHSLVVPNGQLCNYKSVIVAAAAAAMVPAPHFVVVDLPICVRQQRFVCLLLLWIFFRVFFLSIYFAHLVEDTCVCVCFAIGISTSSVRLGVDLYSFI